MELGCDLKGYVETVRTYNAAGELIRTEEVTFDNSKELSRNSHGNCENNTGKRRMRSVWNMATTASGGESENIVVKNYIVRRLTPTECARLQGFPSWWGIVNPVENLTDEDYAFWLDVRNTYAEINGKATKEYTREQMLAWYNKLHSDSAEYKMWGNGIALPNALYVMQGIAEVVGVHHSK